MNQKVMRETAARILERSGYAPAVVCLTMIKSAQSSAAILNPMEVYK